MPRNPRASLGVGTAVCFGQTETRNVRSARDSRSCRRYSAWRLVYPPGAGEADERRQSTRYAFVPFYTVYQALYICCS